MKYRVKVAKMVTVDFDIEAGCADEALEIGQEWASEMCCTHPEAVNVITATDSALTAPMY